MLPLYRDAAAALGIPEDLLARAAARRREGRTVAEALAEAGAGDAAAFARALAERAGLPFAVAPAALPDRELLAPLPMPFARRHLVLPIARGADGLAVAVADPSALAALDDLRFLYRMPIRPVVVPDAALRDAITRAYDAAARSAVDTMDATLDERLDLVAHELDEPADLLEAGDEAPAIRLVNALVTEAVKAGASDIHVEPYERTTAVRFRVDGLLRDVLSPPARMHATIVSRVKIMAGLDIAERRLPQDGRIRLRVAGRDVDVRVSVVPTASGERVVLRLLDRAATRLALADLGLSSDNSAGLDRLLTRSHGLVLVTGPTGSGKTTTLYAALQRLHNGERNIITIEDPVEYQLRGIGQMQVNPRIDLTFASGLRAVLRQDPDVILVGEIRDRETVEIAMQAALTGHLVFSTLHTNDAPSAVTRLLDMGVEPFLIASSLLGVLAQRLVRRSCGSCRPEAGGGVGSRLTLSGEAGGATTAERRIALERSPGAHSPSGPCTTCDGSGYRGRMAIHELLVMDDRVRSLVMERAHATTIRRRAVEAGMVTMRDDGFAKAAAGLTTEAEVLRVAQGES